MTPDYVTYDAYEKDIQDRDIRNLPLTASMQGITLGDIVEVRMGRSSLYTTEFYPEAVVIGISAWEGSALVEIPVQGTKRTYFKRNFPLYALTPIG